jgi:hypothetical protein
MVGLAKDGERGVYLRLPVPPSPNLRPRSHWAAIHRWTREIKRTAWFAAIEQHAPTKHPPEKVRIIVMFRLRRKLDHDNLVASLKPVLDALKLPKGVAKWRDGIGEEKGYFTDDDPDHMVELVVGQGKTKEEPYVSMWIQEVQDGQA